MEYTDNFVVNAIPSAVTLIMNADMAYVTSCFFEGFNYFPVSICSINLPIMADSKKSTKYA